MSKRTESERPELVKNATTGMRAVARGVESGGKNLARLLLQPTLLGRTPGATLRETENDELYGSGVAAR